MSAHPPPTTYPPPWPPTAPVMVPRPAPRWQRSVTLAALALAFIALAVAAVALVRPIPRPISPAGAPAPARSANAAEEAMAKRQACDAWKAADVAMIAARDPFVADVGNSEALGQSEATIAIQVEWLRQHVPAATPPEVATAISDYRAAMIDVAAADAQPGRHAPDSNAAAARSRAAAHTIMAACGIR